MDIPRTIGPYEIVAPLRSGGMAELFLARRAGPAGFSRPVAIKVVHRHLAADPGFVQMFLDEARVTARIHHPNVVHVEDLGESAGAYYLAMEYVHGATLAALLNQLIARRELLEPRVAVAIVMLVADGLHAAHEACDEDGRPLEVVHRDVSPQNILVSRTGHVKLIDFGVAKARGRIQETDGSGLKGKLRYMSPEQAWGRPLDRRADVYSLAIVLWEMLSQQRFFDGDSEFELLERVRQPIFVAAGQVVDGVSPLIDAALEQALEPEVDRRLSSAQAFRSLLASACPEALAVSATDIAALVESLVGDELRRERELLSPFAVRSVEFAPPVGLESEIRKLTREAPPPEPVVPTVSVRRRAVTAGEVSGAVAKPAVGSAPGADLAPQTSTKPRTSRRWGFAVGALAGLVLLGGALAWMGRASLSGAAAVGVAAGACQGVHRITVDESTQHLAIDTRAGSAGRFELPGIRNPDEPPAPEAVFEVTLAGEGVRSLSLNTANPGTDPVYDTIIGVFRGACEEAMTARPPEASFDDYAREFRARGSLVGRGGDVFTVVVAGFGGTLSNRSDRGLAQLDLVSHPSHPPAIERVSLLVAGSTALLEVAGIDPDADAESVHVRFLDDRGEVVPVELAGESLLDGSRAAVGELRVPFVRSVGGVRRFTETASIRVRDEDTEALAIAQRAEIRLRDAAGDLGDGVIVDVVRAELAGPGEPCDPQHVCVDELVCTADARCVPTAARTAACEAARHIALAADGTTLRGTIQGVVVAGPGHFVAPCLPDSTKGAEEVYTIALPPGRWDVVATTDGAVADGESALHPDTILYARRDCLDATPTSGVLAWCNDDIEPRVNQRSRVSLPGVEGRVSLFVELWGSAVPDGPGERYELSVVATPSPSVP